MDNARVSQDAPTASILETLYLSRTERGCLPASQTREDFDRLYELLDGSTPETVDKIINTICHLCSKHERAGFLEGVKVGYQLSTELHV